MINPKKVKAMTHNAMFEQARGREALRIKKYCEDLPVWKSMARSALAGLLLYLLMFGIAMLAAYEKLLELHSRIGDLWTMILIAGSVALFVAIYTIISDVVFRSRYKTIRSVLGAYKSDVKYLDKICREQEANESTG